MTDLYAILTPIGETTMGIIKLYKSRSLKYVPEALQKEVWTRLKNAS